ncbi:MAG: hypothetical protein ACE5KT_00140 [Methanosarcinales archaeon]
MAKFKKRNIEQKGDKKLQILEKKLIKENLEDLKEPVTEVEE